MSRAAAVVGRLVRVIAVDGVGRVRVGHDRDWSEYRVQAWDPEGHLVAEYHTDCRIDAWDSANRILQDLAARAGVPV
jgi:hypothetical protein